MYEIFPIFPQIPQNKTIIDNFFTCSVLAMLFMSQRGTFFPVHREDNSLLSINYCHEGGGKCFKITLEKYMYLNSPIPLPLILPFEVM